MFEVRARLGNLPVRNGWRRDEGSPDVGQLPARGCCQLVIYRPEPLRIIRVAGDQVDYAALQDDRKILQDRLVIAPGAGLDAR